LWCRANTPSVTGDRYQPNHAPATPRHPAIMPAKISCDGPVRAHDACLSSTGPHLLYVSSLANAALRDGLWDFFITYPLYLL
jgi:hypothetical protein